MKNNKAITNMKNGDDDCFKWFITRALNQVKKNSERVTSLWREQSEALNWEGIEFPVKVCNNEGGASDIDRFEKMNPEVGVNVFGYENPGGVFPLRISKKYSHTACSGIVRLLLISTDDKQHYRLINDMSRLLSSQISKKKNKKFFCDRCLNPFGSPELLVKHDEYCGKNEAVKIAMPE